MEETIFSHFEISKSETIVTKHSVNVRGIVCIKMALSNADILKLHDQYCPLAKLGKIFTDFILIV